MDKFEITQTQYTRFLDHIEQTGDRSMDHPEQPDNLDHQPAIYQQRNDRSATASGGNQLV